MKTKFSVGNRITHQQYGEGMIVQIKNNKIDVLFLDEQKRNFSADNDDIKIIGSSDFEIVKPELPIPSASNKIKKELDQLKEGNRVEYFDYEITSQNKMPSFNKSSRVFHALLGEGMITKILKNEYQIIFLNGNKQNIPIDSPDLKMLALSSLNSSTEEDIPVSQNANDNADNLFVGKQISDPETGDGMISKIGIDSYEIIFLDGHKQSFLLPGKAKKETATNDIVIPISTNEAININAVQNILSTSDDDNLTVGKQINHPKYGEGMVSRINHESYEIIFLDGHKQSFPLPDKTTKEIEKTEIPITVFPNESINLSQNYETNFEEVDLKIGKQINHPKYGEGMVSKINDESYEIFFLDGHKQSFPLSNQTKKRIEKAEFSNPVPPKESINLSRNYETSFDDVNLIVGKQINHPEHGEGMISKINHDSYEIIFLNGHKQRFPLAVKTFKDIPKRNSELPITPIEQINPTQKIPFSEEMLSIGKQINHPEFGEGMISKITKDSYEIIFLDGHKQSFSITGKNINRKEKVETKPAVVNEERFENSGFIDEKEHFDIPVEKYHRTKEYQQPSVNMQKDSEFQDKKEKQYAFPENTSKSKNTSDQITKEIEKNKSDEILIGSAVYHPKHGSGIVSNTDEYEIEVVFYKHKKIVYSAKNNELTYLNVKM